MAKFAVIDTETTWDDEVMSIGVVISDDKDFKEIESIYYVIDPAYKRGGMYSGELVLKNAKPLVAARAKALKAVGKLLDKYAVSAVLAYNASFDQKHLPEMSRCEWLDIMKVAAYKQHNKKIPAHADCFGTGRLKCDYGVEPMMRLLSGKSRYYETHNALQDAKDELTIVKLLGYPVEYYRTAQVVQKSCQPKKKTPPVQTGETYGDLTVLEEVSGDGHVVRWKCRCKCGKVVCKTSQFLKLSRYLDCGMCGNDLSFIGRKFGQLTVIRPSDHFRKYKEEFGGDTVGWECQCKCGSVDAYLERHLVDGIIRACWKCPSQS